MFVIDSKLDGEGRARQAPCPCFQLRNKHCRVMSYRSLSWAVRPQVWMKSSCSRLLSLLILLQIDFSESQTDQLGRLHSLQTFSLFPISGCRHAWGEKESSYPRVLWERIQIWEPWNQSWNGALVSSQFYFEFFCVKREYDKLYWNSPFQSTLKS